MDACGFGRAARALAVSVLVVTTGIPVCARAQDAAAQVDAYLAKLSTFEANFTQTVRDRDGRIAEHATGTFALSRPDRFRWEYRYPYELTIVADGKRLWLYDHDLEQVTVRTLESGLGATPALLLSGAGKVSDSFTSAGIKTDARWTWYQLQPKEPSADFEQVSLAFDDRGRLAGMQLQDKLGQVTAIDFSDVEVNSKLDASLFEFTPPKGVDVIGESQAAEAAR
jgi:outer membrane lipoprotein carrier protein